VEHTHEVTGGSYGRLSTKLMGKTFSLPNMMDTYRTCEDDNSYVRYLIDDFFLLQEFCETTPFGW
jgi:hypothetical protein